MKRSPLFYLALITLFGATARIWFFWSDGLHTDELFTLNLVKTNLTNIITLSLTTDCNPPLFYILDWISVSLLGVTNFAGRLPSIIAGIALIPAAYYLGKEYRGETLGLLSALAVSTLGSTWYYSQFGRSYMLQCLLFAVFAIYYIRLVRGDTRRENWLNASICAVLLAYTHLFTIVPLALLFGYLILTYRKESIPWVTITTVLSLPLALLFKAVLDERAVPREIAETAWEWYGTTAPQLIVFAPLEYFGYVFVFWVPLILYAMWTYRKMREITVMVCTAVISFLLLLALSEITPVFSRYLLLMVPVLVTIGLIPVADFLDDAEHTNAQKWFVLGSFGIFYYAITVFAFWSGLYAAKGIYLV
jgi:4-amino-4-deoxy-L-arabinose transferase-like glycosyltransferase